MTQAQPRLLGAVLAGGQSRRYGRDKAVEVVGGVSMLDRAVALLSSVFPDVVVVGGAPGRTSAAEVLPDLRPGMGPLGGLQTALVRAREVGCEGVFLLGCDLPLATPEVVMRVSSALAPDVEMAVPMRDRGIEPLCAAYSNSLLGAVEANLEQGRLSLHDLFRDVKGTRLDFTAPSEEASPFLNVNTPTDRDRAEAALKRDGA